MKRKIPSGAYAELTSELIDEGRMRARLDAQIRKAIDELLAYERDSGKRDGSAKLSLNIGLKRAKDSQEFFTVGYGFSIKVPSTTRVTLVKERNGHLLCQPAGSSEHDPDQLSLYDGSGKPMGVMDRNTGELVQEDPAVAGKVGPQAG